MTNSDSSIECAQSVEDVVITPSRTALEDRENELSDPSSGDTPIRAMHQQSVVDSNLGANEPRRVLDFEEDGQRTTRSFDEFERHTTPTVVRKTHCDVCLAEDESANRVLNYNDEHEENFAAIQICIENNEKGQACRTLFKPFRDAKHRAMSDQTGIRLVKMCRHCERQLKLICFPKKRQRSKVEATKRYIWNRLQANRQKRGTSHEDPSTVFSKKCYLHGHTSVENSCTAPTQDLACPLYLQSRMADTWKIEKWTTNFSKRMGIGTAITEEILKQADNVKLCQRHYAAMRNTMLAIEANANCCTVCGNTGDRRHTGEVTRFPYNDLKDHDDLLCVVEDSLSVLTDNKVQPQDVKNLCSPCRLVIFGRVSMKSMGLRESTTYRKGFDYGPTPKIVLRCIRYVRTQLWEKKRMFVKLKEIHEFYLEQIQLSGSDEIRMLAHKDIRTLRKYLQPPLAQTKIHVELGAKKVGSFFCTLKTFQDIATNSSKPKVNDFKKSPAEEEEYIRKLEKFLKSRKEEIDSGDWDVSEYIREVPRELWVYDVAVFISKSLAARSSAVAKVRGVDVEREWPYNPQECPANMQDLPRHEFAFALSMYYSMERRVFMRSKGQVRGPMFTSLSITGLTEATVAFMSYMNRIACMSSYQAVDSMRKRALARRLQNGPFGDVVPTAFHSIAFDNINVRTTNSLNVHGKNSQGFDGFASQLVNANTGYDFGKHCEGRNRGDLLPKKLESAKREEFIKEMCPDPDDPTLNAYNYIATGLALKNKRKLMSRDPKEQRSLRNILLNAFKGFSGGKAKVVYVTVDRSSAQDEITIVRELRKIEKHFTRLSEETGVHFVLAIVGDQPIFKMLFRLFYESYLTDTRLCKWMIPIPGGFHIEKQGIIPTLKEYLAGSGFEELACFSGLAEKYQHDIAKLSNYRKNRRLLMQILASMLLRLDDVCREEGGAEFSGQLDALLRKDNENDVRRARGEETEEDKRKRMVELKEVLPDGCKLKISDSISPELIKAGKLLCDQMKNIGEHSLNMKFFGECSVLNGLLPFSAYNILTRRGQSEIVDDFWFKFAGLLHGTRKLNYMENMLWYMLVKKVMPKVAYEILYEQGHLFMSMSDLPGSNLHLDEAMEMGIIRHTKLLNTCVAEILEQSPAFTMLVGKHRDTLERNLDPSRKRNARNADLKLPTKALNEAGEIRIDNEKRTAVNVAEMYEFLSRKRWLSKEHLDNSFLVNVLRGGDISFNPFFLKKIDVAQRLIDAEKNGKLYAGLHLCSKMEEIFGELSDEDVAAYFGGKALGSGKWTLAFKFKSMKDMDPTRKVQERRKKRKRTAEGEAQRYLRRRLDMSNHKEKLAKVLRFSSTERKQAAGMIMDEIERNEHIMTEKFFAFRKSLEDDTPNYQSTSQYYENIQDMLIREVGLTEEEYFYDGPGPFVPGHYFSSLHFDVTEWTRQAPSLSLEDHTIGGAIFDKFKRDLRKFVRSDKYSGAVDIHFHADVNDLMPRQRAKRPDLAIDDLALRGCGDVDDCSEPHSENKLFADFNTALQGIGVTFIRTVVTGYFSRCCTQF